jgi:pimeloyl-ACP methyl ester carboxylesterase
MGALGESYVKAQANLANRSKQLKNVKIPALIIHGEEDYLVDYHSGVQTADCIPGAKLVLIPEMGHIPFNKHLVAKFELEIMRFIEDNHQYLIFMD